MYFWKCWRETRGSFYVFLLIVVTFAALLWKFVEFAVSGLPSEQVFALAWVILVFVCSALVSLAAMSFGATGIGEEFAHKTAEFLLTKPRSVRYFVWTAWAANAAQFLTLTASLIIVGASVLSWRYHAPLTGRLLLPFVPGLIMTFLIFGMTYLLAVLHKNGRNGFQSSLGIVIVFPIICWALEHFWQIRLPSPADMYPVGIFGLMSHPELASTFPHLWPLAGWSAVALACPFIAQLVLERTEV
jgi:ABC-type transport system involved in multi-copper enzyme maturation permease subunit